MSVSQNCSFEDYNPEVRKEAKYRCPDLHTYLKHQYSKIQDQKRAFEDFLGGTAGFIPMRKSRQLQFMASLLPVLSRTLKVARKVKNML